MSAIDARREGRGFDESVFFVMLADGKPVTMLRAATSLEGLAYLVRLELRGIIVTKALDPENCRFNVCLTPKGLAIWERVKSQMHCALDEAASLRVDNF
jgi:hypothetical protein